jgi:hypothetical protein
MWHFTLKKVAPSSLHPRVNLFASLSVTILLGVLLAACGSPAATAKTPPPVQPTATATPSPTATPIPTAVPTQPPAPTQAPPSNGPAQLDLQPATMSIVGHQDCMDIGHVFNCSARVISRSFNQHPLVWFASDNIANNVTFGPKSGTLSPGTSITVSIFVPDTDCKHGLFTFKGQSNFHTITWAC